MDKHIAIITIIYKNYTVIEDFLKSFELQADQNYHIYIADATPDRKEISYNNHQITVIPIDNKGYAHGINAGLKQAMIDGIDQFCIINDDVFFKEGFITALNKTFRTYPKTIFGGKIYYAPGYEYHKDRYSPANAGRVIWYAGGTVDWSHATTGHIGVDEVDNDQFDNKNKTDFITGCLTCFDKKVVDTIGFWDERYFLYYEDADYCERAKLKKIPLLYIPNICIWHKNAQSTNGSGSVFHQKIQKKARLRFALKYAPLKTKLHIIKNYFLT